MAAKYILAILACAFLIAGAIARRDRRPQSRTWLLIGAFFAAVSFWLFAAH
jgi:RsiW-degrading membrane proteinase PrsW (M82 family)